MSRSARLMIFAILVCVMATPAVAKKKGAQVKALVADLAPSARARALASVVM